MEQIIFDANLKRITIQKARELTNDPTLRISRTPLHRIKALVLGAARPIGDYQRALMDGTAYWSGSDLRGKARQYRGRYWHSRNNMLKRMNSEASKFGCKVLLLPNLNKNRKVCLYLVTPDQTNNCIPLIG
jgi:hypothetical protein